MNNRLISKADMEAIKAEQRAIELARGYRLVCTCIVKLYGVCIYVYV